MGEQQTFQKQSKISLDVAKFFSCKREEKALLNLSLYDDYIYFKFSKSSEQVQDQRVYVNLSMPVDAAYVFLKLAETVASERLRALNSGSSGYPEIEPLEYDAKSFNKDGQTIEFGKIRLMTEIHEGVYRVAIEGSDKNNMVKVVFGNDLVPQCFMQSNQTIVDSYDIPYFRFCQIIKECIESSVLYSGFNKLASLFVGGNSSDNGGKKKGFFGGRKEDSNKRVSVSNDVESGIEFGEF